MQNRKEDFIEFVKTIKKEVHEWESRHLWASRIFVYSLLLLLVIFVGAIIFANFNLFHTDANSARYMLSAVVQTQSAIVAIVITLTLIAVQLTASAYSPRVIDIFKKNPDMWILLGFYAVSIFYGFIVLKLVEGTEGEVVSQSAIWSLGSVPISFEFCVSLAYWLGVFTFVMLFLYMWNIIGLLKPENIIKRLAVAITKDKMLNPKEDPIQPIADVIHGSRMNDLATTRVGLKTVTDQVIKILDINSIGQDDEEKISEYFCDFLKQVSRLAISREDDESTREIIKNLDNFRKSTAEKGLENVASKAAESVETVGVDAGKKGLEGATQDAARSLGEVGKIAADKGLEVETRDAVWSLGEVGKIAADKGLKDAVKQAAMSLEVVGKIAADKGLEVETRDAARSLGEVGKIAADKGLKDAVKQAAMSLEVVGEAATNKGLEDATFRAVVSLEDVGKAAAGKGLEDATMRAAMALAVVGEAATNKGLEVATFRAVVSLEDVGKAAAGRGKELEGVIEWTAMALSAIGKKAAEQKLEDVITQVALSLLSVGTTAVERKVTEKTTEQVAMSLAVLTTSEKKIVEKVIHEYKLGKPGSASAQKFLSQYNLQLEKIKRGS